MATEVLSRRGGLCQSQVVRDERLQLLPHSLGGRQVDRVERPKARWREAAGCGGKLCVELDPRDASEHTSDAVRVDRIAAACCCSANLDVGDPARDAAAVGTGDSE